VTDLSTPATLAAEFTAPCPGDDHCHRIWIHRDGSVTTPDHPTSDPETVAHALGHVPSHPCARFTSFRVRKPGPLGPGGMTRRGLPFLWGDVRRGRYTQGA